MRTCINCQQLKPIHYFMAFGRTFSICKRCRIIENNYYNTQGENLYHRLKWLVWIKPVVRITTWKNGEAKFVDGVGNH